MPFGPSHRIILSIAKSAIQSFFHEARVINEEHVPASGPLLVVCTHHNMIVDPITLSSTFPHDRFIHYWAKSSLFANPIAKAILMDAGNIPVNRRSKDNQSMFKGTFDALAAGEVVALFPEGTSYTEPRIMQVKDGAAWAALEYMKWASGPEGTAKGALPLTIVPVGLVYTNKSKYRSCAVLEYGKPIDIAELSRDFNSDDTDAAKRAVKRLTKRIEASLITLTINAPDWETLYAGRMARDLLWEDSERLNLDNFVAVSQTLVDIFTYQNPCPSYAGVKEALLKYSSLLKASKLTNEVLSSLPLPRALDPSRPVPVPSRISTLFNLLGSTIACLLPLPFFAMPLLINAPAFVMSRFGANLVIDEEETQAQNKIVFGLLLTAGTYGFIFLSIWVLLWWTPLGAVLAASVVWLIYTFYLRTIDGFYARAKKLIAAWRVLIGVWGPRRWDMNPAALAPFTVPEIPPPNIWIDRPLMPTPAPTPVSPASPASTSGNLKKKKPASRSLIRHVLRARTEASQALAVFLADLERMSPRVRVSAHMGHPEGTFEEGYVSGVSSASDYLDAGKLLSAGTTPSTPSGQPETKSYLEGREIIEFLRARGAKIEHAKSDADWVGAASSDEGEDSSMKAKTNVDEVVWVPSAR